MHYIFAVKINVCYSSTDETGANWFRRQRPTWETLLINRTYPYRWQYSFTSL